MEPVQQYPDPGYPQPGYEMAPLVPPPPDDLGLGGAGEWDAGRGQNENLMADNYYQ